MSTEIIVAVIHVLSHYLSKRISDCCENIFFLLILFIMRYATAVIGRNLHRPTISVDHWRYQSFPPSRYRPITRSSEKFVRIFTLGHRLLCVCRLSSVVFPFSPAVVFFDIFPVDCCLWPTISFGTSRPSAPKTPTPGVMHVVLKSGCNQRTSSIPIPSMETVWKWRLSVGSTAVYVVWVSSPLPDVHRVVSCYY